MEGPSSAGEVVVLAPRLGRFAHTVYQEDLLELLRRSREFSQARDRYDQMKEYIKAALRGGAHVEPGLHQAYLENCPRSEYTVTGKSVEKLVVR